MEGIIPLSVPNFEGNESKYVNDALSQGWVSTGGAYITELEKKLAGYLHTGDVAACQSGTSAIHLALVEAGVKPGDMVIVPTLTFIAAVNPVKYQFADPVFIDCDASLCIDPAKIELFCEKECEMEEDRLIYKNGQRQVKAIVVVHVFGNMADMEAIMEIAGKYNLKVIEDATEALGTCYEKGKYEGKYAGTIGDFGAYSFNGNKIITTGGGGAVTAGDTQVVGHLRYLSTQAKNDPHNYIHHEIGFNYRMTNLQAALGVAQMEELPDFVERKNRNYKLYKELFYGYGNAMVMPFRDGVFSNKWFYSLEINRDMVGGTIQDVVAQLEERGVQTRPIWGLIHEQEPYKDDLAYMVEKAQYYSSCILNVPCSTQITKEEIAYVAGQVKEVLDGLAE